MSARLPTVRILPMDSQLEFDGRSIEEVQQTFFLTELLDEVGYARALNKPTILLAQHGKELPFDIRSYRVIFYDDSIGGKPLVEKMLREHLHAILQEI